MFCTTVQADAVESSNVVGYQGIDISAGEAMINPSFLTANGGEYLVSDIKVEGAGGAGDVSMQNMNSDGTWSDITYYYLTLDGTGYVEDGWYRDIDGNEPVDETDTFKFGYGISFTSNDNDLTLTYSGSVAKGAPVVEWTQGDGYLGNPTPVTQYIGDILIEGAGGSGDVSCQKMLPNGTWADVCYYYLTLDGTGYVEDGWYRDIDGNEPVDETDFLAAGEAISFTSNYNDLTITFKKAID